MQCANMNDHKDIGIVLDMRSNTAFNQCSLNKSINFPIERFTEKNFIDWKKQSVSVEKDSNMFLDDEIKKAFINRKRRWIFIIVSEKTTSLKRMLLKMHAFGNREALAALVAEMKTEDEQRDLLSLRNALLIYMALKNERCREMDFCFDGFEHFRNQYPHFCRDSSGELVQPKL